ncbi:MAG: decarboxylating 6-phosphogluconate dehydrogenase [Candidatus Paceibacterota bacterium]
MEKLKIGFVGLGRMGSNMVLNLLDHDYEVVVYNRTKEKMTETVNYGATPASTLSELVRLLPDRKVIWLMVNAGEALDQVLAELTPLLNAGDIVIDGGNSYYQDSQARYRKLKEKGISFMDCGTSGGMGGARHGACLMIGGDKESFDYIRNIFRDLAITDGFAYLGNSGAGHYVKMVHNGIEYGMMSALGEGFEVIKKSNLNIDLKEVAKVYSHGSIVESKLMGWLAESFNEEGYLDSISGNVPKGETEEEMKKLLVEAGGVMPTLDVAIKVREQSRVSSSYTGKLISAMRNKFGGHKVNKAE